jgi:Spy/CpxP family protein refolding chaperone
MLKSILEDNMSDRRKEFIDALDLKDALHQQVRECNDTSYIHQKIRSARDQSIETQFLLMELLEAERRGDEEAKSILSDLEPRANQDFEEMTKSEAHVDQVCTVAFGISKSPFA